MASEYLKWKYRDVKPREKVELTAAEKRKNWWHYHKWYVVIAMVLAGVGINLVWHTLTQVKPDYQIAYVAANALPDDTAAAIETAFAALGEDLNGDGRVIVQLNQYAIGGSDPQVAMASQTTLMSDILECESYFFLLEDPAQFQEDYHALCRLDGSLPEVGDEDVSDACLSWAQCPALAAMDLGSYAYNVLGETVTGDSRELAGTLFLARRGFLTEKTAAHPEGCAALWDRLTEGAIS